MQGPGGLDVCHAIWGGGHGCPVGGPVGPRCSLPKWTGGWLQESRGQAPQSSHQALCSPGSVSAVTSHVTRPRGWAVQQGSGSMCTDLHIHLLLPPENSRCCEGGSVCGRRLWGLNKPAGSFLPPSGFPSSLLPASPEGRAPGLWDGKQKPRSGRSRHGQIAVLSQSFPWKSPESMVELGMPATCLQAPPTPPRLLEDSRTPDLLRLWSGQVCPGLVCTGVPLHLDELRGRGLKRSPGSRVQER